MDSYGFIHEKTDIKLLILFLIKDLPHRSRQQDYMTFVRSATAESDILTISSVFPSW